MPTAERRFKRVLDFGFKVLLYKEEEEEEEEPETGERNPNLRLRKETVIKSESCSCPTRSGQIGH